MIKSFSGQVVFCFAILRAISAYVGENRLSQYSSDFSIHLIHFTSELQTPITFVIVIENINIGMHFVI